jgi:hypothetical protein
MQSCRWDGSEIRAIEPKSVTSACLGIVKCGISVLQKVIRVALFCGKSADPDTRGNRYLASVKWNGICERCDDVCGNFISCVQIGQILKEYDELVATQPRDCICLARALQEAVRRDPQDLIAGQVSVRVIDLFELIQINHQESQPIAPPPRAFVCDTQPVLQQKARRQSGQTIMQCPGRGRDIGHPIPPQRSPRAALPHEALTPVLFRRIEYWNADKQEILVFFTNLLHLAASTVAAIYKDRWAVELFFKALKQTAKVKSFLGTSANAVKTQIWTALIGMLILKYLQMKSSFGWSLSNLAALLRQQLFIFRDLWAWLNNPLEGPPAARQLAEQLPMPLVW